MSLELSDRAARRGFAFLAGVLLSLAVAAVIVPRDLVIAAIGVRPSEAAALVMDDSALQDLALQRVLSEPEMKARLEQLIVGQRVNNIYDAFPDPEVGRVLLRNLDGATAHGIQVDSNAMGLRERWFAWRKPEGTTRVILLGDSFIFGYGADAEDRLGVVLRELLEPHCPTRKLEVLHVAVSSWNLQSECVYLRRHLHALQPDLVLHVGFANDLGDVAGVRGLGTMARFSPQAWLRGESFIGFATQAGQPHGSTDNHLVLGLDWESRARYARAAESIRDLASAVTRVGGRYVLIAMLGPSNAIVRERLAPDLEDAQVAFVASEFNHDVSQHVSSTDQHWNSLGHQRMAGGLYALIAERALLADWELEVDDESRAQYERIFGLGAVEASRGRYYSKAVAAARIGSEFVIPSIDAQMAAQATGGIDRQGHVAPYASLIFLNAGSELVIAAEPLGGQFREGAEMTVFVEEFEVGTIALDGSTPLPARFDLPGAVGDREYVGVRLVSDDSVYTGTSGERGCLLLRSMRLE